MCLIAEDTKKTKEKLLEVVRKRVEPGVHEPPEGYNLVTDQQG